MVASVYSSGEVVVASLLAIKSLMRSRSAPRDSVFASNLATSADLTDLSRRISLRLFTKPCTFSSFAATFAFSPSDLGWYLINNLPNLKETIKAYKKRMGIEAMFKDCKSGGYNLEQCKGKDEGLLSLVLLIAIISSFCRD